ncbi:P-loop containing nucleoside triphosphate hydrolase protein [Abortiporus biennis]|nr:P-loop containing nucleoside triphosphate hydrolase protein [Abortiporus biennis]
MMRRPTQLVVDTSPERLQRTSSMTTTPSTNDIKPSFSPRSSVHSQDVMPVEPPTPTPPQPSIRLLFSYVPRRDVYLLLLPAILMSMFAGGIAPFMTLVVGQAFDVYSKFPVTSNPPASAKTQLLHDMGLIAAELTALAIGALALSSLTSSLWIWIGERNLLAVRKAVYTAVTGKDLIWFDTKMGAEDAVHCAEGENGPVGAGGLMAKFVKETDDVRMASSLASGMIVQYLTTTITCLILAFTRSWSLTFVILSAVPVLMVIQMFSQNLAGPKLTLERAHTSTAATLVDRAIAAISTVKAFNAEHHEQETISVFLDKLRAAANGCITVWGITSSMSQFVMMAMFVQGFWFGSKLVREGKNSPGDVSAVFWACLIASSNLQMCIPQLIVLAKGKFAIASLVALAESVAPGSMTPHFALKSRRARTTRLRKIVPTKCNGEIEIADVTFAYPSRPDVPVLKNLSLFLPAKDMTFIVGGSGSGKSTIAQLLLRLYDVRHGQISLDSQDLAFLDEDWTRQNISAVSQSCILFDMSVHDNIAMGVAGSDRKPEDVTREEVIAACTAALMHDFVRDLPDGYDTKLGNGGANLSGGQKQRLAIARALLRNPAVLILDEATSALDATSRLLVFEAIKAKRYNMTTIVITHDLSQIERDRFVFVLKDGELVEQGFRFDLEEFEGGEFRRMSRVQSATGGFQPREEVLPSIRLDEILERQDAEKQDELESVGINTDTLRSPSIYRPITMSNWMLEAVADLTKPAPALQLHSSSDSDTHRISRFVPADAFTAVEEALPSRHHSLRLDIPSSPPPVAVSDVSRRFSLPFTPTSPTRSNASIFSSTLVGDDDDDFEYQKSIIGRSHTITSRKRSINSQLSDTLAKKRARAKWDEASLGVLTEVTTEKPEVDEEPRQFSPPPSQQGFWSLIRDIYPTVPRKPLILVGIFICLISGSMTPIFSYLLSRLLYEVSVGAQNTSTINLYGGIVLAVAAADGIFLGLKYFIMEYVAMDWVNRIRKACLRLILSQDKKWFDKTENSPVRLMQILIKDGDDARSLIATCLTQGSVVLAMLTVGLIWALIEGWQLTLVGLAIAPVFALTMTVQTNLVAKCEYRNKRAREEVAKGYYDAISNVRTIRAMGFESAFQEKFDKSASQALSTGMRGAFVEGCTYGVASALIYLAEALIFYVGAVLLAHGTYDYLRILQVLNLVVFTVTIGSQLMAFTQRIAKSVQATRDFNTLLKLSTETDESRGTSRPSMAGSVSFNHVSFSYPERPDVPILKDLSMHIANGEFVAIVGASGSGKSTLAALLQRLYEPVSGSVSVDGYNVKTLDVHHLRERVSVVSQQPNLFDATIADNIAYGDKSITLQQVQVAAKAANVHEFIMSLPKGYDTMVGENASLISGGQAQRLQIARALARPSNILILDECTSALDPQNQSIVLETIKNAKVGRTTFMVTHKLQAMRMCDRILVVDNGVIVEQGTYEYLIQRRGVFAQLASGGEWMD